MKHVIKPVENFGVLQGQYVLRLLYHANLAAVAVIIPTDRAGVGVGSVKTDGTQPGCLP
jgi:hypothetical protein